MAITVGVTIIIPTFACEYRKNVDLTKQVQGDKTNTVVVMFACVVCNLWLHLPQLYPFSSNSR